MDVIEETIEATLESNGQLQLTHQPGLPPGPVRVTIRVAATGGPRRGLADVIREIAAEHAPVAFPEDRRQTSVRKTTHDSPRTRKRDREQDRARRGPSLGGP